VYLKQGWMAYREGGRERKAEWMLAGQGETLRGSNRMTGGWSGDSGG
jgi:hypothetical protein